MVNPAGPQRPVRPPSGSPVPEAECRDSKFYRGMMTAVCRAAEPEPQESAQDGAIIRRQSDGQTGRGLPPHPQGITEGKRFDAGSLGVRRRSSPNRHRPPGAGPASSIAFHALQASGASGSTAVDDAGARGGTYSTIPTWRTIGDSRTGTGPLSRPPSRSLDESPFSAAPSSPGLLHQRLGVMESSATEPSGEFG